MPRIGARHRTSDHGLHGGVVALCGEYLSQVERATKRAPGNAGELVAMYPRRSIGQALSEAELPPVLWSHQKDLGSLDEEGSQVSAAEELRR